MRRITYAIMGTISALVLLFSYHTSTNSAAADAPTTPTAAGAGADDSADSSSGASAATGSESSSSSSDSSSGTFKGEEANTRWGIVQVEITVKNGKITKSEAVEYPTGNPRDQEINSYALPQLNAEVVTAQGDGIDAVSGATVTSDGYIQSLQSALDKANL
jgi:uncharacterized protein with FMN-binding domain